MKGLILAALGVAMLASSAQAQTDRRLAIGVGLGFHKYIHDDFSQKSPGVGLVYRIGKPGARQGWSLEPKGTVDWFSTNALDHAGGVETRLGKIRSIPVLVGAGPSYRNGRTKVGIAVMAGPSFNHFTVDKSVSSITVKSSVMVRPEASLWYDVSSRLGVHVGLGYVYSRPSAETTSGGTTTKATWKTDHVNLSVGLAVGIF
jgi:opacity protein-like surface antigen